MINRLISLRYAGQYSFESEYLENVLAILSKKFHIKNYKLYRAVYVEYKRKNWFYDYPYHYRYLIGKAIRIALKLSKKEDLINTYGFFCFIDKLDTVWNYSCNKEDGLDSEFLDVIWDKIFHFINMEYFRRDISCTHLGRMTWEKYIHALWCITVDINQDVHIYDFCTYLSRMIIYGFTHPNHYQTVTTSLLEGIAALKSNSEIKE